MRFIKKHDPVICKVFSFEEVKGALKYLESGSHFGNVVFPSCSVDYGRPKCIYRFRYSKIAH